MSERDYMAEFNEASSRSRDILIEAGGHINYLRSLLRDLLPFLPKNHPWLPGINEQIEALPVEERDATIAALQRDKGKALLDLLASEEQAEALQVELERYKAAPRVNAIAEAAWGVLNHDNDPHDKQPHNTHLWEHLVKAIRKALEPPSGSLTEMLQSLPVIGVLNVDNPHDPRHKEWKDLPTPSGETSAPLEILLCVHGIPIDSPSACPSCHAAASAQITNRVIGFAVFTDDIATAALYPLDQTPNAFDAAKRWHASITAITVARGSPEPPLSAEWCKHCGCGNDTRKYAHLPGCPAHLCEYVSCKITVPHDHSVGGPASAQEQKK